MRTVSVWLAVVLVVASGGVAQAGVAWACDEPDIDAQRIARTSIARRLVAEGFAEEPVGSGLYRRAGVRLKWLEEHLGLTDRRMVPCTDSWMERGVIEGNHTVLELADGDEEPAPGDRLVDVTVNLGYARPEQICAGMTVHRVEAALRFAGAEEVKGHGKLQAHRPGFAVRAWTLPDGTALVVEWKPEKRDKATKPTQPQVTSLIAGEPGKGFVGWQDQDKPRQKKLALQRIAFFAPKLTRDELADPASVLVDEMLAKNEILVKHRRKCGQLLEALAVHMKRRKAKVDTAEALREARFKAMTDEDRRAAEGRMFEQLRPHMRASRELSTEVHQTCPDEAREVDKLLWGGSNPL